MIEKVLKAAIKHPETGMLYVAQSHRKAKNLAVERLKKNIKFSRSDEGFVTTKRRFVNRDLGTTIAHAAEQIPEHKDLFSYDLPSSYKYDY